MKTELNEQQKKKVDEAAKIFAEYLLMMLEQISEKKSVEIIKDNKNKTNEK